MKISNFAILRSLLFKFSSDEVAEAATSLMSTFSTDQSLRRGDIEISNSVFISLRVWVAEAIRITAKQANGAMALEELGLNPQRAIDILTKIHYRDGPSEMASSLVSLAVFLEEGCDGVQKDLGRAVELYARAIDDGNSTHAMWRLAKVLCRGGEGVQKDNGRALQLYNRSVDGGNVEAMFELGNVLAEASDGIEKVVARAAELYRRAMDEGSHVGAMSSLGGLLEAGMDGVEKNRWSSCRSVFESYQ